MRAEQNWDEIGKRLRDQQATPPPLAWDKIRKEIKPRRRYRWWLWLPVLLVLLGSLPVAYKQLGLNKTGKKTDVTPAIAKADKSQSGTLGPIASAASVYLPETSAAESKTNTKKLDYHREPVATMPAKNNLKVADNQEPEPEHVQATDRPDSKRPKKTKPALPLLALVNPEPKSIKISKALLPEEKTETGTKTNQNTTSGHASGLVPEVVIQTRKHKPASENTAVAPEAIAVNQNGKTEVSGNTDMDSGQSEHVMDVSITSDEEAGNGGLLPANDVTGKASEETQNGRTETAATANVLTDTTNAATANKHLPADSAAIALKTEERLATPDSAAKAAEDSKTDDKIKHNRWNLVVYGTPQYAFQRIQANTEDNVMVLRMNNRNELSDDRLGYELGFRGQYKLAGKFGLEAGLNLGKLQQRVSFTTATGTADSMVVSQAGNGQINIQTYNRERNQEFTSEHLLGGIYLGGTYAITGRLQLTAGAGSNWILSTQTNRNDLKPDKGQFNPYVSGGLRYDIPVSQKLTLQAGPVANYYLKPMQQKTTFCGGKPVTFGLFVGLRFNPGK